MRGVDKAKAVACWHGLPNNMTCTWRFATILHPLGQAPWSVLYGMLTDRFNVTWIVDVEPAQAA